MRLWKPLALVLLTMLVLIPVYVTASSVSSSRVEVFGTVTANPSSAATASIPAMAECCAANTATVCQAWPTGSKWIRLENNGPTACSCTFDGSTPVLGTTGVHYAAKGASASDPPGVGPGWLPATALTYTRDGGSPEAPAPAICVCTSTQSTGACLRPAALK